MKSHHVLFPALVGFLAIAALGVAACSEDSDPVSVGDTEISLSAHLPMYTVEHLPSLGGSFSIGNSINNLAEAAGSSNLEDDLTMHATLWQGGVVHDLGTLGGPNSSVQWPGQNDGGMIVGIAETGDLDPNGEDWSCSAFFPTVTGHICRGFVYESGVMTGLDTFGGPNGFATGVNARGQVVGWAETEVEDPTCNDPQVLQFRAALWEPRTDAMRELPPLPGDSTSAATAINARGTVVGISGDCDVAVGRFSARHAVRWQNGVPEEIGNLGGISWHTPMAINARGDIVGFSNPPGDVTGNFQAHAFLWTEGGGVVDLQTLPGNTRSQGLGINGRGQIVGLSSGGPPGTRAFLYQDGAMIDLNTRVPGYTGRLVIAGDINDAGVITGLARDADGNLVTFVATPVGAAP